MTGRSHLPQFSQNQGHYLTSLSFSESQSIIGYSVIGNRKFQLQKDLGNKASITSYLMKSRGREGIGCLAAHTVIQNPAFFPSLHSTINDWLNLRLGNKMAAAITGMTSRHGNPFAFLLGMRKFSLETLQEIPLVYTIG